MSTSANQSQRPTTSKLRLSCNPCAAAKVGCNKDKPTCARCAKRGLLCEYVATKRAGRTSHAASKQVSHATPILAVREQSQSSPMSTVAQALHMTSGSPTTSSMAPAGANVLRPSPSFSQPSTELHTPTSSDILAALLSPIDYASASMPATTDADLDDLFASVVFDPDLMIPSFIDSSDKCPNILHGNNNNNNNLFPDASGAAGLPTPTDTFSSGHLFLDTSGAAGLPTPTDTFSSSHGSSLELPNLSNTHSPSNGHPASVDTDMLPDQQGFSIDSPCCCLVRALDFFTQLFPNASEACTQGGEGAPSSQLLCFQRVIEQNEQVVEEISQILQCSCSYDGYLLVIVSLVVFKTLGWYTAAVCATPVEESQSPGLSGLGERRRRHPSGRLEEVIPSSPITVGGYHIDGEDQGRIAAQLVLSELHGVQRLVNLLSQRLLKLSQEPPGDGGTSTPLESAIEGGRDPLREREIFSLPFSAKFFKQLEAYLRKRLRALSRDIVDMLRRA